MPVFAKTFDVKLDRFTNELQHFFARFGRSDAAWKIRHVSSEGALAFLDYDHVLHGLPHFLSPACLRALLKVPGGISTLGLPATVTVPGFVG